MDTGRPDAPIDNTDTVTIAAMTINISRSHALAVGVAVLCLTSYLASLGGGYLFDDFQNILANPALRALGTPAQSWFAVAFSSDAGELRRPLSMLSFGLDVAWFGMNPLAAKIVNLLLHLLNGWLVYLLALRLAPGLLGGRSERAKHVALFAAAAWLLHPLQVSTVAYIVQRMTELSALFTLLGLAGYLKYRQQMLEGRDALANALACLLTGGIAATLSKENGVLIIGYALVIEATCLRFAAPTAHARTQLRATFAVLVGLPATAIAGYLLTHPNWLLGGYAARDFTLGERLLTQARVLWDYLGWTFWPDPRAMGLYHDDIATSHALFAPPVTALAVAGLAGLVVSAWLFRRRVPAFSFAIAWFLVGHSMESSVLPLELVFEHRNYLPTAGLLLGASCLFVACLPDRINSRAMILVGSLALGTLAALTAWRARDWGEPLRFAMSEVRNHPSSARNQYAAGRAILLDGAQGQMGAAAETLALPYFHRATKLDPNSIHGLVATILIDARRGPVSPADLHELAQRLRVIRPYNKANPFLDLLSAAGTEKLSLDGKDLSALVDAAMDNPQLPAKVRARVLNNYGAWQFNVAHDAQAAVSLTSAAAALQPTDAYYPLNLAQIASLLGQRDKALEYLTQARKLDATGAYAAQISDLLQQLDATQH